MHLYNIHVIMNINRQARTGTCGVRVSKKISRQARTDTTHGIHAYMHTYIQTDRQTDRQTRRIHFRKPCTLAHTNTCRHKTHETTT